MFQEQGLSLIRHWVEDENRISQEALIQHFYEIVNYGPATIIRREKVENTERKLTARETQPRKTDVTN